MIQVILTSLVVFLAVMLVLVALLLFVRAWLVPAGDVTITINQGRKLTVPTGSSLISTLAQQRIYLPSACGGKGSCGQCRVRVLQGGGMILPTEIPHFTRRQVRDHWRLGCQVKVKEDMGIEVPESVLSVRKWECEVVSIRQVATFLREFVVKLPEGEHLDFRAGGYIQIDVPKVTVDYAKDIIVEDKYRKDWERFRMFDLTMVNSEPCFRAYSMANHPAEGNIVMLNVRIATPPFDRVHGGFQKLNPGVCSSYIWSRKPGDKVMVSGPYGDFHVKETDKEMIFVGGGAGMAPMRSQIFDQFKTRHTSRKASFWYGGRSRQELFYVEDFREIEREYPNFSFNIALSAALPEDHWTGYTGFIHQALWDHYLKDHPEPEEIEYYLCGPGPMTSAVVNMLDELGVPRENIMFDDFGG